MSNKMQEMVEKYGRPQTKPIELNRKPQGALNRSARANIVLAAKASWGERITLKDKQEIEKLAKEIAKNTQTLGPVSTEYKLQKLVSDAGLGKLARKGILRNGQRSKLRASQLIIALEAGNENTEE